MNFDTWTWVYNVVNDWFLEHIFTSAQIYVLFLKLFTIFNLNMQVQNYENDPIDEFFDGPFLMFFLFSDWLLVKFENTFHHFKTLDGDLIVSKRIQEIQGFWLYVSFELNFFQIRN